MPIPAPAPATLSDAEHRALSADLRMRDAETDGIVTVGDSSRYRAARESYQRAWDTLSDAERDRVASVIRYRNREGL